MEEDGTCTYHEAITMHDWCDNKHNLSNWKWELEDGVFKASLASL